MKKDLLLPMADKVLLVDGCIDELVDQAAAGTVATVTLPTTQMSDSALAS